MLDANSKVLLVDDFDLMRTLLRQRLNGLGFRFIDDAKDGAIALEKISSAMVLKQSYDVIFLDWNMPNKTGIQVLEELRKLPELKDLIIIMVTAEAEKKYVLRALTSGATDYIVKPCSLEILQAKIEHINAKLPKKAG